ncbi:MAG: hypothetical protein HOI95_29305 [Chromatiales bacterium]|jgi:hypothetical protein|nr:hypothetical protein [Chromatiales bacterium]
MFTQELAAQLHGLRAKLGPDDVAGGILSWLGGTPLPDGSEGSAALSQAAWENAYNHLWAASLRAGQVPPINELKAAINDISMDGVVPLAVASFDYAKITPAFVAKATHAAQAGTLIADMPADPTTVLQPSVAFLAACPMHEQWDLNAYRARTVRFRLDRRFWFSNYGVALPERVYVDPGDGLGGRTLTFGDVLTCVYPRDAGTRSIRVSIDSPSGQRLQATVSFTQVDGPVPEVAAAIWPLVSGISPVGQAWWHPADANRPSRHAAILVEGFPGGYAHGYLYEMFNQHGMLRTLQKRGYDVLLVGFANGLDRVEHNALTIRAAVATATAEGYESLVVGGVSMGGLVVRYALTEMESLGVDHATRVFFTIDTPHRGAYTSYAVQWFVQYFAKTIPEMAQFSGLLNSPSNQQFITNWFDGQTVAPSPMRSQMLAQLKANGNFPKRPSCYAVACGRGDGKVIAPANSDMFDWSGTPFFEAHTQTLPDAASGAQSVGHGTTLVPAPGVVDDLEVTSDVSWEGMPGGYNQYSALAAMTAMALGCGKVESKLPSSCAIPTISALDLDMPPDAPVPSPARGNSPFDDYFYPATNLPHVQMSPEMSEWLLTKIGFAPS